MNRSLSTLDSHTIYIESVYFQPDVIKMHLVRFRNFENQALNFEY
jgi:hypothetical protein